MNDPLDAQPRPRRSRRRAVLLLVAFYLVAISATIPLFETPDSAQSRRLAEVHREKAAGCRRAASLARSEGRGGDADRLAQSAVNHDWFAEVYQSGSGYRITWLTKLLRLMISPRN